MIKVYTLEEARKANISTLPGIYFFKNKINNKYYIGQAINIRKRFKAHLNWIKNQANYPIYKAIIKYGEENFEYGIIGVIDNNDPVELLKKKLDIL